MSALIKPEERVLSTLNADGSRRWLDPKPVEGFFRSRRKLVGWVLIAVFVALPHLHAGGRQLFLMDIAGGEFTLFGVTFLRTDTLLLALSAISVFVTVFLVTALFGRVWCGWACPQTVYLEFVFRPIGALFDGKARKGLRGAVSALPRPVRAGARWAIVAAVCFFLANTFLAYFVGSRTVLSWSTQPPWVHPLGFAFVVVVTALMVGNFEFFREQLCFIACPYGRFQSVMLDKHSLIVGYDGLRGEPRGRARRAAGGGVSLRVLPDGVGDGSGPGPVSGPAGDCVDCNLCVAVCPTGIDIRDGLQLECIHCARCIDACDRVMTKLGREPGLIRYSSQAVLSGAKKRFLRARVVAYPLILSVVMGSLLALAAGHAPADVRVVRDRGQPFYVLPTGEVTNQLRVRVTNRTDETRSYTVSTTAEGFRLETEGDAAGVGPGETRSVRVRAVAEPGVLDGLGGVVRLPIELRDDAGFVATRTCKFIGPIGSIGSDRPGEPAAAARAGETNSTGATR